MKPARLAGVAAIEIDPIADDRGFFARSLCATELATAGIEFRVVQCNISFNRRRGTLRGMHYQVEPHAEAKFVRCTSGALYDVVIDLRPGSATYLQWESFELSAANRTTLYVPPGFAHGFQTLDDDTEVFYQMSAFHVPEAARGIAWDDPAVAIAWPLPSPVISERDRSYPRLGT